MKSLPALFRPALHAHAHSLYTHIQIRALNFEDSFIYLLQLRQITQDRNFYYHKQIEDTYKEVAETKSEAFYLCKRLRVENIHLLFESCFLKNNLWNEKEKKIEGQKTTVWILLLSGKQDLAFRRKVKDVYNFSLSTHLSVMET